MLSIAGIPLCSITAEQAAYASAVLDPVDSWPESVHHLATNPGQGHFSLRSWLQRPIKLGSLTWPHSASRWAQGWFLITTPNLTALRAKGSGPLSLVIDDGNRAVTIPVYPLPPRPFLFVPPNEELWLLPVTDARWAWWSKAANLTVAAGASWASVYAAIAAALGITLTVDTVPGAYLTAPAQLTSRFEQLPPLLDAVAASVGQRIVVDWATGNVRAMNGTNGATLAATNLAAGFPVKAGGPGLAADLTSILPSAVTVGFPRFDTTENLYSATVTPARAGSAGTRPLRSTAVYTGTNATELTALAQQIADDWSRLQCGTWDISYIGPVSWQAECLSESIEWQDTDWTTQTRVRRAVWDDWPTPLLHKGSDTVTVNTTLATVKGASLVPVGGYFGATGASSLGSTPGVYSPHREFVFKDGVCLKVGDSPIFTYINDSFFFNSTNLTVNSLTINSPNQMGPTVFNSLLEICGWQFWCCDTYSLAAGTVQDLRLPGPATVFPITAAGSATITSIVPAAVMTSTQTTSTPARVSSDTIAAATFPVATTASNTLLVRVFGNCSTALTSRKVEDSASNSYTEDKYIRHTSGVYAGIYRASNAAVTDPHSVSFSFSGGPGTIEILGEEVAGLVPAPVDQTVSASGTNTIASPGTITPTFPFEYIALAMSSAEAFETVPLVTPADAANLYIERDGLTYTAGSCDFWLTKDTSAYTPNYTTDESVAFAAVAVSYKSKAAPQLIALTNTSATPIVLQHNGAFTAGLGKPILLPESLRPFLAIRQYEIYLLWYDACDADGWRVFASPSGGKAKTSSIIDPLSGTTPGSGTVELYYLNAANTLVASGVTVTAYNNSYAPIPANIYVEWILDRSSGKFLLTYSAVGVEAQDDSTTLVAQPITSFVSTDTTTLTVAVENDPIGHRAKVKLTAVGGAGALTGARRLGSGFSCSPGTTTVTFGTVVYDDESYTSSSLGFTAPEPGIYNCGIFYDSGLVNDTTTFNLTLSILHYIDSTHYDVVAYVRDRGIGGSTPALAQSVVSDFELSSGLLYFTIENAASSATFTPTTCAAWIHKVRGTL